MKGPLPRGTFVHVGPNGWERILTRGQRYRVVQTFHDSEHDQHEAGKEWFYVGSFYNFYDEILSVYFADDNWSEFEVQLHSPEQDAVCDHLRSFFESVPDQFRTEYFATAYCPGCKQKLQRPAYCDACHEFWDPA
jgi:hypothetical protein